MSAEEKKAIMLRALDALAKGNLDIIDELFSPSFVFQFSVPSELAKRLGRRTKNDQQRP